MAQGQSTWESQGYGQNDYVVPFETEKMLAKEYRHQSAFGKLSSPVSQVTVGQGREARNMDIGASACIWSKEETNTDQCRFTLEQNIAGAPTFGESEVRTGEYLAYMHAEVYMNQIDSPAIPMIGDMSRIRIKDVISNPESNIRREITLYLAEQYIYDVLDGHFQGANHTLLRGRDIGGRAVDLDRGAGIQVSPENFLVAGSGFVSGISGTTGYETQLVTDLTGLTNTASDMFSRTFIHNMRAALTDRKIAPVSGSGGGMGDGEKWYAACDPDLLTRLTDPGGSLYADWQQARERAKGNPVFGHGAIELDGIIFFPEQRLKQYKPDISGSEVVWGIDTDDRRKTDVSARTIGLMVVMGNGAMLNAHNGSVSVTQENGRHGKGKEFSGHVRQGFMRTRYRPKDGRTNMVIQQSSMTVAFYEPGVQWS